MFKQITLTYDQKIYVVALDQPFDISMPLKKEKETANCYYAENISYQTIEVGDFVGSVIKGGSCNYQRISFTPHGNGTHTECYGHLTENNATINDCLKEFLFFATLISVPLEDKENGDKVVTLQAIQEKLAAQKMPTTEALIIRTLPNTDKKLTKQYSGTNPPYLAPEICTYLREKNIKHLLLDLPSVDKEWDNGVLAAHREFWNLPPRYMPMDLTTVRTDCTITELIFVPTAIKDGNYLLNIQIASFESDASPSKPILYSLKEV